MRHRLILLSLLVPLALLLAAAAALVWLFETDAGLQWAYAQLRARVPGALEIEMLDGKLAGPINMRGLSYRDQSVDIHVDRGRLDWSPAAVLLGRLQIDSIKVEGVNVNMNESAKPGETRINGLTFPLNIALADVRLDRLRFERRGQRPYIVHSVELAGFLGRQVARVDRLTIDAADFGVDASGTFGLAGGTDQTLRVRWRIAPPGQPAIAGHGRIGGNLSRITLVQQITAPIDVSVRAEIRQPFTDPHWKLNADAPEFDASRLGLTGQAMRTSISFDATGGRAGFDANGVVHVRTSAIPELAGNFTLHGATSGDEIVLDQLTLRVPDTDMQLTGRAQWHPFDTTWKANAQWQHLRWPAGGDTSLESPSGTLQAEGTYQRYHVRLDFTTADTRFPRMQWRATGTATRRGIVFNDISVDALQTKIRGTANVAWSPRFQWKATLNGRGINPAAMWPEWPGSLALRASLSGDTDALRVNVESLRGTLRKRTFRASASVYRRGADYPDLSVTIDAGKAQASVHGRVDRRWQVSWQLDAPDLGALIPRAGGRVNTKGSIGGARALPRIKAQLSARDFAYRDTRIREATLDAAVDLSDAERSHAAIVATHGALLDHAFERIAVDVDGHRADHVIKIDVRLAQAMLQAVLRGKYADATWSGSIQQSELHIEDHAWMLVGEPKLTVNRRQFALAQSCWHADGARACVELRHAGGATTVSVTTRQLPLATLSPLLINPPEWHGTVSGDAKLLFYSGRLSRADARLDFSAGDVTLAGITQTKFAYDSAVWKLVVDDNGLRTNAEIVLPGGDGGTAELALPQFHSVTDIRRQPMTGRLTFAMHDLTPLAALLPQLEELRGSLQMKFTATGTLTDPRIRGDAALANVAARIPAAGIRVHDARLTASANGGGELRLSGEARSGPGRLDLSGRVVFPEDRAWRAELDVKGDQFQVADLRETQIYVSPNLQAKLTPGEIEVTGEVRLPKASIVVHPQKTDVVTTSSDVVIVNAPENAPAPEPRWKVTAQIHVILGDAVTFSGFGLNAKIAGDVVLMEAPTKTTTARGEVRVVKGQYDAYGQKLDIERGRLVFVGGPVNNPGIDARAVRKIAQTGSTVPITAGVQVGGTLQAPQLTLFSDPTMSQTDTLSYLLLGRPAAGASAAEGRSLAAAALASRITGGEGLAQRIASTFGIQDVEIGTISTPGTTASTGPAGTSTTTATTGQSAALVLGKQLSPRLYINYSIGLFTPENALHLKYKLGRNWSLEAQSGARAGGDLIFSIEK